MFEATRVARERALAGEGLTLIEAVTMRMHGHAAHDDMRYVPKALLEEWARKDPIERQERRLAEAGVDVEAVRAEVRETVERATEEALAMPMPSTGPPRPRECSRRGDPPGRRGRAVEWPRRPGACERVGFGPEGRLMAELTYLQAISDGLREEMRADERSAWARTSACSGARSRSPTASSRSSARTG